MKHSAFLTAALLATSCLTAGARADLIRPDRTFAVYEAYALSKPEFSSVGYITRSVYDGTTRNASGFYAGDGLFITTAHSLRRTSTSAFYTNFQIGFGTNIFSDPGEVFDFTPQEGVNMFTREGFTQAGSPNDIAVLYIPELMNLGLAAIPMSQDTLGFGTVYDLASYGAPGVAGEYYGEQDGQFRAGTNAISSFDGNFYKAQFNSLGSPFLTDLESGGLAGASGSPLLIDGVAYALANYEQGAPEFFSNTGFESLATHYDWIESIRDLVTSSPDADFNNDGQVNLADLNILLANFGQPGDQSSGDADGNGTVDLTDLNIVLAEFGI